MKASFGLETPRFWPRAAIDWPEPDILHLDGRLSEKMRKLSRGVAEAGKYSARPRLFTAATLCSGEAGRRSPSGEYQGLRPRPDRRVR